MSFQYFHIITGLLFLQLATNEYLKQKYICHFYKPQLPKFLREREIGSTEEHEIESGRQTTKDDG